MSGILAGKRAYVTGGSSGIGAGIVKTFAAEGARVAIGASRHADEARVMAKSLPAGSGNHIVVQADLYDRQQTERAAEDVIAGLGGLDIFVHSAGIDVTSPAPMHETSDDLWDRMMTLHLTAAFRLSRRLIQVLLKADRPFCSSDRSAASSLGRAMPPIMWPRRACIISPAASPPTTPRPACAPTSSGPASSIRR
jgi:NAD(P)-dependent dehydrogenase (short-subunit alcohol dehydrogenase family)